MATDNTSVIGGRFHDNLCFGVRFFDSDVVSSADNNVVRGAQIFRNGSGRCSSAGGGIVLGDVSNLADGNEIYENASGLLVFGFKPTRAAKVSNNKMHHNAGIGIQIMSGASNTDVRNNTIYQNGVDIIDEGESSVLTNNGRSSLHAWRGQRSGPRFIPEDLLRIGLFLAGGERLIWAAGPLSHVLFERPPVAVERTREDVRHRFHRGSRCITTPS